MKPIAVAACLLFAATMTQAQTAPATQTTTPTDPKAPAVQTPATKASATTTKTPAAPGKTPAKKDDKKPQELPKIPGVTIVRPNGNLLGLEVVGGVFKLSFYDKKHKPMAADVTRATARWPNMKSATPGQFRTVLNPNGTALIGQHPVQPPYTFNVFLNLLQGDGDDAKSVETYTVPFRG